MPSKTFVMQKPITDLNICLSKYVIKRIELMSNLSQLAYNKVEKRYLKKTKKREGPCSTDISVPTQILCKK